MKTPWSDICLGYTIWMLWLDILKIVNIRQCHVWGPIGNINWKYFLLSVMLHICFNAMSTCWAVICKIRQGKLVLFVFFSAQYGIRKSNNAVSKMWSTICSKFLPAIFNLQKACFITPSKKYEPINFCWRLALALLCWVRLIKIFCPIYPHFQVWVVNENIYLV